MQAYFKPCFTVFTRALPLALTGLALTISGISHAATYQIDPAHANVRFAIDHFGTSTNTGGAYNLTGTVNYDPKTKYGYLSIAIPLDTINTGNRQFDKHLKGKDFFDVEKYPMAFFKSTKWHFTNDKSVNSLGSDAIKVSKVDGYLTLHGETHPVSLTATKFNCYVSPVHKKSVCGGDFKTTIDRTDWGINKYVLLGMTKNVELNIQMEAIKQ